MKSNAGCPRSGPLENLHRIRVILNDTKRIPDPECENSQAEKDGTLIMFEAYHEANDDQA
jgi:hypothetical protein